MSRGGGGCIYRPVATGVGGTFRGAEGPNVSVDRSGKPPGMSSPTGSIERGPTPAVWLWPTVVFLVGLALTTLLGYFAWQGNHARDLGRFENSVQRSDRAIQTRLDIYIGLLRAGAGFFAASTFVDPKEFRAFAERIDTTRNYPGVQGIGFAERVRHGEKTDYLTRMRAQLGADFEIMPAEAREDYYPIVYLHPLDRRNQKAIGYDMFSEPIRQEAMRRARDQGTPAVSGRVVLVQEIDAAKQTGFLVYVPVYRGGAIPQTVEERRERNYGFIYSPFRTGDLFARIFGDETNPRLSFEIYDGTTTAADRLIYRSSTEVASRARFTEATQIQVADRVWTVVYRTTPGFELGSARKWTLGVSLGGVVVSAILGAITLALARSRVREALRSRELFDQREHFRVTLASIGDAVISTDKDGRVNFMNPVAEQLTGWALDEARGRKLSEVFPIVNEDTGEAVPDPVGKVLRSGAIVGLANHTVLLSRRGERIPIEDSAAPISGGGGELLGVVLVFHDVTARRQAEDALEASEARKDTILHSALDAIITIDDESRLVEFNAAAEHIFGYPSSAVIGRSLAELIIPERYRAAHHQGMARYLATGEGPMLRRRIEVVAMRADGTEFPAELAIVPIPGAKRPMFTAFLRDITDRKRADEELREAAERFRFMADAMPAKVFTARPDGESDFFNRRWIEYTAATVAELRERGWLAFVHPDEAEHTRAKWRDALERNEPFEAEHRLRDGGGNYRWHLTRAQAFRIDGLGVRIWIGSATDIEDTKREEERLEGLVAERTAALTELNEQLESFVYAIAHDLRSPLRTISGYAHILNEEAGAALDGDARNLLRRINGSAEFMNRLIEDLLAFGRTARAQMQLGPVEVQKAWDIAIAQTSSQIEHAEAQIRTDRPLPVVCAHEATLGQVFANLLGNAIKFVPQGVRPSVWFYSEERGENVRLCLRDNGIGIPADQHARVFRVFERLHGKQYSGTGIGLSIVRKGIERMGGKVGFESTPGKGSTFWVELRLASAGCATVTTD